MHPLPLLLGEIGVPLIQTSIFSDVPLLFPLNMFLITTLPISWILTIDGNKCIGNTHYNTL